MRDVSVTLVRMNIIVEKGKGDTFVDELKRGVEEFGARLDDEEMELIGVYDGKKPEKMDGGNPYRRYSVQQDECIIQVPESIEEMIQLLANKPDVGDEFLE